MQDFITQHREEIAELCRKHHVRHLAVFGSAVRDDFDPERSDLDLRVEFQEHIDHYARNLFALEDAFKGLFARDVDMLTSRVIRNPYLRRRIEADQITIYAA